MRDPEEKPKPVQKEWEQTDLEKALKLQQENDAT